MKASDDKHNSKLAAMAAALLLVTATSAAAAPPSGAAQPPQVPDDIVAELVAVVAPQAPEPRRVVAFAKQRALLNAEVSSLRLERAKEIAFERVEIAELADLEGLDGLYDVREALDRDRDIPQELHAWIAASGGDEECLDGAPDSVWSAAADMVVSAARLPARAGLVARHLLLAFAKVTPRVVRALL